MFIAAFLVLLPWIWFIQGSSSAIVLIVAGAAGQYFINRQWVVLLIALGGISIFQLENQASHALPRIYQHNTVLLDVCVEQPPKIFEEYSSVNVRVVEQPDGLSLRRIKLTMPKNITTHAIFPGDCFKGSYRVSQPLGRLVPGAFNADRYYFSVGVDAKATLKEVQSVSHRQSLSQKIYSSRYSLFENSDSLEIWTALTFGWSNSMSVDLKKLLSENQLIHLFVISGMHIGFISLFVLFFLKGVTGLVSSKIRFNHQYLYSAVVLIVSAYVAFLGWPTPATRALIMAGFPLLIFVFGRKMRWYSGIWIACIVITIATPQVWLSIGPWLSFISVLVILLLIRWRVFQRLKWLARLLAFQLTMSLTVVPWSILFGFQTNLLAGVINFLITPIVSFILLPLSFLVVLLNLGFIVDIFEGLVYLIKGVLVYTSEYSIQLPWFHIFLVIAVALVFVITLWFPSRVIRTTFFSLAVLMLFVSYLISLQPNYQDPLVTVFDVAHGQAILIEENNEKWLYDTGGVFGEVTSVYELYLDRVIPEISGLIVSHSDKDHSGGVDFIQQKHPNLRKWAGQPGYHDVPVGGGDFHQCQNAGRISDNLFFIEIPTALRSSDNDHSCILVFQTEVGSLVITGDAGRNVEYYLLQEYPELIPFDVVMLGHHGSSSSSAKDWLNANSDSVFVLSTGDRASPKWPSKSIIRWFENKNKSLLSTAMVGTIQLKFTQAGIRVKTWDSAYRNRLIY